MISIKINNKFIIFSLTFALIILLIIGVFYYFLNSDFLQPRIKSLLIAQLEDSLGKRVEIDSLDNISLQSLQVNKIIVFNDQADKKDILLQAEKVKIDFNLVLSLLDWKNWELDIHAITIYNTYLEVVREIDGQFDLLKKFDLEFGESQQNIFIDRVYFQDSHLTLHDKLVYFYEGEALTTQVENINGYLDLSNLPEIIFDFQGNPKEDSTTLILNGNIYADQPYYTINFTLKNADLTHFQHYLEIGKEFNINKGKFDLDLNLNLSSGNDDETPFWQGEIILYQVQANPLFLEEIPLANIHGSINILKPEITISKLEGLYRGNTIELSGLISTEPEVYVDLDLKSTSLNSAVLKSDLILFWSDFEDFSFQGDIDLSATIQGQPEEFQIEAEAYSPKINIENIDFQNIDLEFSVNKNGLVIHSLTAADAESSLAVQGHIDWSEELPYYQILLKTTNFSLHQPAFNQLSFLKDISGNLDSNFKIENTWENSSLMELEGQFTIDSLVINNIPLADPLAGELKSTVNLANNTFSIQQGKIELLDDLAFIEGNISFAETARFALNIEYQTPEISNLINFLAFDQKIAGSAEIEAAITGNASNPDIIAEFRLQELSFQEYFLGNLNGILTLQNNIISLQDFSIKNQELNLISSGNINLNTIDAPEIDLVYQLESINIENLGQIFTFSTPLSGSTSGNGIIQGIWPVLTLSGNFLLEEILYDNYPLGNGRANFILQPEKSILYPVESEDSLSALLNINGYTYSLLLEELDLKNEMMELLVYGKIKIGEDFQFSGETEFSSEYIIDLVESFYPLEYDSLKEFLPSNINGRVAFSGDKDKQQMELSLQILPQIPDSSLASEIEAEIAYQEQRFFISDFRFIQPAGQLRAEGSIGLDQVLDINFQAEQLDIKTLLQLIDTQETANGIMDIEGTLKGILTQPEILIVARMQEGDFREFKFEDLHADFYWNSQNRNLEVRDFILSLEEEYQIVAQGNLPLDSFFIEDRVSAIPSSGLDFPLDFQIKMEQADLNILNLFWKDIFTNYTGNIDLNLSLTGTSSMPLLNGYIDIQEGGLSLKDFPVKLEQVDTRIKINDNEVIILPIPLTAFENQFTLEGHFKFISFYPENISISIKNIPQKISFQNIIESEIIFTAETKGSWPALEIESQLYLTNGHLNLNQLQAFNLDELIPESQDSQSPALPVQLDMNIVIADPFTLMLPNAEIYITGNALLTGQLDDPAIQGNINLRRGSLVYLERQFNITEGRAAINGFTVNDININARAETMVQDVLIMIDVSGNLAQPQVRLSSQPVMLETEIISLLTLGRNIEGLSEGELNQLLSQELIEILFQSIQINLLRQIESGLAQQLGLDFLRLSTENLFSDDDSIFLFEKMNLSSLKLEVGKNISDDFFISYTTPLDFQGEKIISIDYQVSSDLSLNTQFEGFSINDSDYRFKFGLNLRF